MLYSIFINEQQMLVEKTPNQKGGKMKKYEISHSTSVGEPDLYIIWDVTGKERELYCFYTEEYKDEAYRRVDELNIGL